jgi:Domain of Unknown Function (DUF1206)
MSNGLGWRRRTTGTTRTRRRYEGGRWRGNGRRTDSRRRYGNGSGYRDGPGRRRTLGSGGLDTFARVGFVARGIAYIVIGAIAVMVALGIAQHAADRSGAIEAIASKPFGYLLLWVLVIGFLGLAVWRFVQAAVARLNLTEGHRLRALIYGIGYAIAFLSVLMFVLHGTKPTGSDASAHDYTARMLALGGGRVIVAFAGIVLVVLGLVMAVRGFRAEFTRHLRMGWMSGSTQDTVVRLGQAGYVARGAVVAGIGIAALDAASTFDAAKAKGVDGVLREFAQTMFGPWLLILVALGLIAFGLLSFFEAKWRRTFGGVPV